MKSATMAKLFLLSACVFALAAACRPARAGDYTVEKDILLGAHDGVELFGDLYIPEGKGPFPGILFLHGGGFVGGTRNYDGVLSLIRFFAENGYMVLTADYRYIQSGGMFPNNTRDAKCAMAWFKAKGPERGLDPGRVATSGESAGAYLAAMVAFTAADPYFDPACGGPEGADLSARAAVLFYGPYNFASFEGGFKKILELEIARAAGLNTKKKKHEFIALNSPVNYVRNAPPTLVINTEIDGTVPPQQSDELAAALAAAGRIHEQLVVTGPDMNHGFVLTMPDSPQALQAKSKSLEWLARHLAPVSSGNSMD